MSSTYCAKVSPSRFRRPDESDREQISRSLNAAVHLSLEATVSRLCTNQEYVIDKILSGEVEAVVIDNAYLLVYAIGSPWYSLEVALQELLVLRIGTGSEFSVVTDYLDDIAEVCGCSIILAGGALARNSRAITRLYQRQGYSLEGTPQFTKRR